MAFVDELTGLRAVLCYRPVPETDVLTRWVEFENTGSSTLEFDRLGSAGVCVPTVSGARLTYLTGQWSQEFTRRSLELPAGGFRMESRFGVPGHAHVPWLAVQDASGGPAWGVSLEWPGSWSIEADVEPSGLDAHPGRPAAVARPGPAGTGRFAGDAGGRAGVQCGRTRRAGVRAGTDYDRVLAGPRWRRPRPVLYNSWEATGFDVRSAHQLELAKRAADIGVELFVVDDGWFTGRDDDTGGLGDWTRPAESRGFGAFVDSVRELGLEFGLWVEPEAVSPKSRLYAEHPDWVYRIDGRPATLIRNQLLLDLGLPEVVAFVKSTLDTLLSAYPISYLKWDMNRPPTERGRPGSPFADLDAEHVAGYLSVLDHLRAAPSRTSRSRRARAAAAAPTWRRWPRTDVVWPSDNTGPLDRLTIQDGFLLMHAPHLMSSWVTDSPGVFDPRPRSLRFRFVTAMAGRAGDRRGPLAAGLPEQLAEAASLMAVYKSIRASSTTVSPGSCTALPVDGATQYTSEDGDTVVVLAWNTGR